MASGDLSGYVKRSLPKANDMKFGIVTSQWNKEITDRLTSVAITTLLDNDIKKTDILTLQVPGSFELIYGCKTMLKYKKLNGLIAVGSLIKGETKHFDFIASAVAQGIKDLNIKYDIPTIFCVLTSDTRKQAFDRSGGKLGNKGAEAAFSVIEMANLKFL